MFERFTGDARAVVRTAVAEARALEAEAVRSEHLLIAVAGRITPSVYLPPAPWHAGLGAGPPRVTAERLRALVRSENADAAALETLGISLADVRRRVDEAFGPDAWDASGARGSPPFAADAREALELALREAIERRARRIT